MPNPQFRSASSFAGFVNDEATLTEGAGWSEGDFILALFVMPDSNAGDLAAPAGWTTLAEGNQEFFFWLLAYIVRGSAAPGLAFQTGNGNSRFVHLEAIAVQDCNPAAPIQAAVYTVAGGTANGHSPDPPNNPASGANVLTVCGGGHANGPTTVWAAPAGYTLRGANNSVALIATADAVSSGAQNPDAFSGVLAGNSYYWDGFTIALQGVGGAALTAAATDTATASGSLLTAVRLAASAASAASASASLTNAIRLAANALASATASGVLNAGAVFGAAALDVATATAALTIAVRLNGAAVDTAVANGTLTDWASVTLAGPQYTGPGGIHDPNFWIDDQPTVGATLYYDAANITIYPNGEISSASNNCQAVVQFLGPSGWALGLVVITPHLVGYANSVVAASAQLSSAIRLSAAASALATAAGALGTGAGLSAAAVDAASASGALTTAIPISALAANVSTAVANLTNQIKLTATASDVATMEASLNGVISLSAAAAALSTLTADLSAQIRMSGNAAASATAVGTLTTGIRASATAQDVVTASASLATAITLGGAANSAATASGNLSTFQSLLAAAIDTATAVASISTGIELDAVALAVARATGIIVSSIALLADGAAEATATAVLTDVITTPPVGIYASDPRFVVAKSRWSFFGSKGAARFDRKTASEKAVLTFDFSGVLAENEALSGPITLTIEATSGTDANARDIFNGYPAYDMTKRKILLPVKAGLRGRYYYVTVAAATSNEHKTLELSGLLPIKA